MLRTIGVVVLVVLLLLLALPLAMGMAMASCPDGALAPCSAAGLLTMCFAFIAAVATLALNVQLRLHGISVLAPRELLRPPLERPPRFL